MSDLPFIRPAKITDLDALTHFSKEAGFGFTNLPRKRELLAQMIQQSLASFQSTASSSSQQNYLFVLEVEGKVIGTSAIVTPVGLTTPFYIYQLDPIQLSSPSLNIKKETTLLRLTKLNTHPTQVETLFLDREYRGRHLGRLLSLSRFLFIASFRSLFAATTMAELRGFNDSKGHSPFWDGIGRHFFDLAFDPATTFRIERPECLEELFPTHPIYLSLLPREAQAVVGKTHPETARALQLLEKQGFKRGKSIDIFDGGPHLFAPTDKIQAVRESLKSKVGRVQIEAIASTNALISNCQADFRACVTQIEFDPHGALVLNRESAEALKVQSGDEIRYLKI